MLSTWMDPYFLGPGRSALRKKYKITHTHTHTHTHTQEKSLANFPLVQDPIQACTFCLLSRLSNLLPCGTDRSHLSLSCRRLTFMEVQCSYFPGVLKFGFVRRSLLRGMSVSEAVLLLLSTSHQVAPEAPLAHLCPCSCWSLD